MHELHGSCHCSAQHVAMSARKHTAPCRCADICCANCAGFREQPHCWRVAVLGHPQDVLTVGWSAQAAVHERCRLGGWLGEWAVLAVITCRAALAHMHMRLYTVCCICTAYETVHCLLHLYSMPLVSHCRLPSLADATPANVLHVHLGDLRHIIISCTLQTSCCCCCLLACDAVLAVLRRSW
jgi:hypothetical protein